MANKVYGETNIFSRIFTTSNKYIEDLENINVQISDSDGERLMHSNSHTIISLYDFIQEQEGQTDEEICYTHCNIQIE